MPAHDPDALSALLEQAAALPPDDRCFVDVGRGRFERRSGTSARIVSSWNRIG